MANRPIKTFKKGKMQLSIWQGEFDGKPTNSFSIKKSYYDKQSGQWKDTVYFSLTDLADIHFLTNVVISNNINKSSNENKQQNNQNYRQQPQKQNFNQKSDPYQQPVQQNWDEVKGVDDTIPF